MLTKISNEFKVSFLLQFTRELIKNSGANEFLELETILKKEEKNTNQEISKKIREKQKPISVKKEIIEPLFSEIKTTKWQVPVLRISEPRLPQNF